MLEIIATNEGEEFFNYYPEWTNLYQQIRVKYDALIQDIETQYSQYKNIAQQKDFAMAIKHLPYAGILFNLRKGKINSIRQSLAQTSIQKLENLLQISDLDQKI